MILTEDSISENRPTSTGSDGKLNELMTYERGSRRRDEMQESNLRNRNEMCSFPFLGERSSTRDMGPSTSLDHASSVCGSRRTLASLISFPTANLNSNKTTF